MSEKTVTTSNSFTAKNTSAKKKGFLHYVRKDWILYLLLIVPLLYYLVFCYLPLYGLTLAFKEFNPFQGFLGGDFVGFAIFKEVFQMDTFLIALRNTLLLNGITLVIFFPCPIIMAILLNELRNQYFKKMIQSIIYLPYFLSWVIIGGMLYQILSEHTGAVNHIIEAMGFSSIPFLTNDKWWIFTFIAALIWQGTGYNAIVYLAAITGINPELYEAAIVDGCGRVRLIWHITLPCIKPVIVVMWILAIGGVMSIGFDRANALGNPTVYNYSDVISTFVYRVGIQNGRFSVATAVGLFQSVVGFILLFSTNWITKKIGEEGIW